MAFARTLPPIAVFLALILGVSSASAQDKSHPTLAKVTPDVVWLGDSIEVEFEDSGGWLATDEAKKLVLYLNGHAFPSVKPLWFGEGIAKATFHLTRDESSSGVWATLLAQPDFKERPLRVQVGLPDGPPFPVSDKVKAKLRTLDETWFGWAVTVFAVLLIAFLVLAVWSDLLREGDRTAAEDRRPYSLGRVQMAVFFFLVIASFIFVWMTTGAHDPLTTSVLALLGISAGTAASGAIVDANKDASVEHRGTVLSEERQRIETELKALEVKKAELDNGIKAAGAVVPADLQQQLTATLSTIASKQERLRQIDQELSSVAALVQPAKSEGFLTDVLSDAHGVSFHRFQIVVWTLVLACIFVDTVYNQLVMPTFDTKLLALMGLSAGTYLGFKFPEAK